jgi:hypothetical protein
VVEIRTARATVDPPVPLLIDSEIPLPVAAGSCVPPIVTCELPVLTASVTGPPSDTPESSDGRASSTSPLAANVPSELTCTVREICEPPDTVLVIARPSEPLPAVNDIEPLRPTSPAISSVPFAVIANDGVAAVASKLSEPVADSVSADEPVSSTWPEALPDAPATLRVIEPLAAVSWIAAPPVPEPICVDAPVTATVSEDGPAVIANVPWIAPSEPSDRVAGPVTEVHGPVVPAGCVSVTMTFEPPPVLTTTGPKLPALS